MGRRDVSLGRAARVFCFGLRMRCREWAASGGEALVPEMICLLGGIRCSYVLMGFCDSTMRTIRIGKLVDEYETGVKNKGGDTNALFLLLLYYLHPG